MEAKATEGWHLPEATWKEMQEAQQETHPTITMATYEFDIVIDTIPDNFQIPDPTCESGKRKVTVTIETYVTVTIIGQLVKDEVNICSYKTEYQITRSSMKARIVSHEIGDCVPV